MVRGRAGKTDLRTLQLREHITQVAGQALVGCDEHGEAVLCHTPEGLGRINFALIENVIDAVLEEFGYPAPMKQFGLGAGSATRMGRWFGRGKSHVFTEPFSVIPVDMAFDAAIDGWLLLRQGWRARPFWRVHTQSA